jgi:hypothetical protein
VKSINQRIFEEVLEPKFPGEFITDKFYETTYYYRINDVYYNFERRFERSIEDAFWLAEKVGLFKNYGNLMQNQDDSWSIGPRGEDHFNARTIQDVICKAVLDIYGRKV